MHLALCSCVCLCVCALCPVPMTMSMSLSVPMSMSVPVSVRARGAGGGGFHAPFCTTFHVERGGQPSSTQHSHTHTLRTLHNYKRPARVPCPSARAFLARLRVHSLPVCTRSLPVCTWATPITRYEELVATGAKRMAMMTVCNNSNVIVLVMRGNIKGGATHSVIFPRGRCAFLWHLDFVCFATDGPHAGVDHWVRRVHRRRGQRKCWRTL